MKYVFIVLIFSSLSSQVIEKQNKLLWDGTDWNSINKKGEGSEKIVYRIKSAYLNGLLDGYIILISNNMCLVVSVRMEL